MTTKGVLASFSVRSKPRHKWRGFVPLRGKVFKQPLSVTTNFKALTVKHAKEDVG